MRSDLAPPPPTLPDTAARGHAARWRLQGITPAGLPLSAELDEGHWLAGGTEGCDLLLADLQPPTTALALHVQGSVLALRPAGAGPLLLLADDGVRSLAPQGERFDGKQPVRLRCGGVDLQLVYVDCAAIETEALPVAPSTTTALPARGWSGLRAACAVAGVAVVAAITWPGPSGASRPPATTTGGSAAQLQQLLAQHRLDGVLELRRGEGPPALHGVLADEAGCARLAQVRKAFGADRFSDRVTCLPVLAADVRAFLAGSGLQVQADAQRVVVSGTARDAAVQAQLAAAVAALGEPALIDVAGVQPAAAALLDDNATRQLRKRIAAIHPGLHGHVVTRDGRHVYAGGRIADGVELVEIDDTGVVLRTDAGRLHLAL